MSELKPARFRAYAHGTLKNRAGEERAVEHLVAEGNVKDGKAEFTAKEEISQLVYYGGPVESEVCLGRHLGPIAPGKISLDFADVPESEPAPDEIVIGGITYKKAD